MIFEKYALPFFTQGCQVLEIGPDQSPSTYQRIVSGTTAQWDSLDIAGSDESNHCVTYIAESEYCFPIPNNQYDVVISANVIEHVRKIWRWMPELARVCKPGGVVITVNPVSFHYHEAPVDCWRIYPDGMKALSEDSGLEVVISVWESVELGSLSRILNKTRLQRVCGLIDLTSSVLPRIRGFRIRGAFDTITIARKPDRR
jgi:SAM-dependent methyltransferase